MVSAPVLKVIETGRVSVTRPNRLANMYVLSPYVWREAGEWRVLLRAVPRRDDEPRLKMSEIWCGRSLDGRHFEMESHPTLFPGPDAPDLDGCEDPTVCRSGALLHVWYTGHNVRDDEGRLLAARGPDAGRLTKTGIAIDSSPPFLNPKEAALASIDGGWRMFFEYARDGLSAIGVADAATLDGPWGAIGDAALAKRPGGWDDGHMSPGPVIRLGTERPIMFYNGADGEATWRIGWAIFDRTMRHVVARCEAPLITPTDLPGPDARDMAFVASVVEENDRVRLYYTVADMDLRYADVVIGAS